MDVLSRGEAAAKIKCFFEVVGGENAEEKGLLEFFTEPVTIDEFAEELGVSKPTAYQRLEEIKDELDSSMEGKKKFYQRKK